MWAQSAGGKIEDVSMVLEIGPRIIDQVFQDTLEERAKAAEDEVRNTREELRQAELKRQKEVQQSEQRAADTGYDEVADNVDKQCSCHTGYDEDESEDGSEDDDNEENWYLMCVVIMTSSYA
ncbi:unnamed protein product [Trifolium pratense]|uniref:Uncharacterized protein n=1 Tax=Trifolium pratense TaxID=57577 RepID=A0ACB0MCW3_TRIPR|nr:unnamed protein product [Trifolium pratense]